MMTWDCTHCGAVRHAPCGGATCLPAQRIDEREFKSARIAGSRRRLRSGMWCSGYWMVWHDRPLITHDGRDLGPCCRDSDPRAGVDGPHVHGGCGSRPVVHGETPCKADCVELPVVIV